MAQEWERAAEPGFPWDRMANKFDWIRLVERLPADSPLFAHDRCRGHCTSADGRDGRKPSSLSPATVSHVGTALALAANLDGSDAHPSMEGLAERTKRHPRTVRRALTHLETVQLVAVRTRAGTSGVPRTWANSYWLTVPPIAALATARLPETAGAYNWFARKEGA